MNGGVWASINGTLIWALSLVDGDMAWDEWKKNTLAIHAESYPEVWYGIWSGPDTYNSNLSKYPGQTVFDEALITEDPKKEGEAIVWSIGLGWTDFPVFNLHPHAWPLYCTTKLIGSKITSEGIEFVPTLPKEEYEFSSPVLGFKKSKNGYSGWYSPKVAGIWKISLKLNEDELKLFSNVEINGKEEKIAIEGDRIVWSGKSAPEKPFRWELKK